MKDVYEVIKIQEEEGEFNPEYPVRKYEKQAVHKHKLGDIKLMAKCLPCTKVWSENSSKEEIEELIAILEKVKEGLEKKFRL